MTVYPIRILKVNSKETIIEENPKGAFYLDSIKLVLKLSGSAVMPKTLCVDVSIDRVFLEKTAIDLLQKFNFKAVFV